MTPVTAAGGQQPGPLEVVPARAAFCAAAVVGGEDEVEGAGAVDGGYAVEEVEAADGLGGAEVEVDVHIGYTGSNPSVTPEL